MSEDKPKLSLTARIITIIFAVISLLSVLLFLAGLILAGNGIIRLFISVIWLISAVLVLISKNKVHFAVSIVFWLLLIPIMGFSVLFAPFIHSYSPWKYSFQRAYIDMYNRGSSKDFPDKLPSGVKSYEFDYMPSILQGTGHCSARFTASEDIIKDYESEYAPQAIYTIPLENFNNGTTYVETISPQARQSCAEDDSLDIWEDEEFWADTDATVYVLSAVHNWNHPHSSAVIISKDHTKIQFTQLG